MIGGALDFTYLLYVQTLGWCRSTEDGFEERIACELDALEHMEGESRTLREHVSCEDLLEFACDVPNSRRTRGKSSGVNSDEVRIMGKVLGNKVRLWRKFTAVKKLTSNFCD